jgi:hypothetical protein
MSTNATNVDKRDKRRQKLFESEAIARGANFEDLPRNKETQSVLVVPSHIDGIRREHISMIANNNKEETKQFIDRPAYSILS